MVDVGGYVGSGLASALNMAKLIGISLFFIILIVVATLFIISFMKYDIDVIIFSQRTGSLKIFRDKGAIVDNKLKLFKARKIAKAPEYKYLLPAKKGTFLLLYQVGQDDYVPLDVNIRTLEEIGKGDKAGIINMDTIPSELKLLATIKMKENRAIYGEKGLLEKYLPYMVWALIVIGCIIIFYIVAQSLTDLSPALNNVANALKETAKSTRGVAPY